MEDPPEELSVHLGSNPDGWAGQPAGRSSGQTPVEAGGAIARAATRVNAEQASKVKSRRRASNERAKADAVGSGQPKRSDGPPG